MPDRDLAAELSRAREEIDLLRHRLELLEQKVQGIPTTSLLHQNFVTRAFAVVGHHLVGSFVISILLALLFVLMQFQ